MSQLFVCNSTMQRLSMCKFMLDQNRKGQASRAGIGQSFQRGTADLESPSRRFSLRASPLLSGADTLLADIHGEQGGGQLLRRLSKRVTRTLKREIRKKATTAQKDSKFEQDVINEEVGSEDEIAGIRLNERPPIRGQIPLGEPGIDAYPHEP